MYETKLKGHVIVTQ